MNRPTRDPLNWHQPHTPDQPFRPDSARPTCSQPSAENKGCDQWKFCPLGETRERQRGPVQVAVEDHRGVEPGRGRRFAAWCFLAVRGYFGQHAKPGYTLCEDRIYHDRDKDEWKAKQLKPYAEQGPYPFRPQSAAPSEDLFKQREAILAAEGGSGGTRTRHAP